MSFIRGFLQTADRLFFPASCAICQRTPDDDETWIAVCPECADRFGVILPPFCDKCGMPYEVADAPIPETFICGHCLAGKNRFDMARSAGIYKPDTVLAEAILRFKYGEPALARTFASFLASPAEQIIRKMHIDFIIPVPLHPSRERARRYNQSALLADLLGRRFGIPTLRNALIRVKRTPPQSGDWEKRRRNVRGAFKVRKKRIEKETNLILVDDVMTTGATSDACAAALKRAGAGWTGVLTIARAGYRRG